MELDPLYLCYLLSPCRQVSEAIPIPGLLESLSASGTATITTSTIDEESLDTTTFTTTTPTTNSSSSSTSSSTSSSSSGLGGLVGSELRAQQVLDVLASSLPVELLLGGDKQLLRGATPAIDQLGSVVQEVRGGGGGKERLWAGGSRGDLGGGPRGVEGWAGRGHAGMRVWGRQIMGAIPAIAGLEVQEARGEDGGGGEERCGGAEGEGVGGQESGEKGREGKGGGGGQTMGRLAEGEQGEDIEGLLRAEGSQTESDREQL